MRLDHVVFAAADLDAVTGAADRVGLATRYGGAHPDADTEMALLALGDGSYVEFLAGTGGDPGWWPEHIARDAGPADWCLRVERVDEALVRSIRAGLAVRGPLPGTRDRPDGRRLEWEMGWHLDDGLPFCIADRTPREWRVPDPDVGADGRAASEPHPDGIADVVLAVPEEAAGDLLGALRRRWGLPTPREVATPLAANVRDLPGTPLSVAVPEAGSGLAARTDRLGAGPCAFLLDADPEEFRTTGPDPWSDGTVHWFDDPRFEGRLGVRSFR